MNMSEEKDPREKFKEALEKKKAGQNPRSQSSTPGSKFRGGQSSGGAPKMFRRKSGSS